MVARWSVFVVPMIYFLSFGATLLRGDSDAHSTLATACKLWRYRLEHQPSYSAKCSGTNEKRLKSCTVFVDGEYSATIGSYETKKHNNILYAYITNSNYAATLEKSPITDQWVVSNIALSSEANFPALIRSSILSRPDNAMSFAMIDALEKDVANVLFGTATSGEEYSIIVEHTLTKNEAPVRHEVIIDKRSNFPTKYEVILAGGFRGRHEFEWSQFQDSNWYCVSAKTWQEPEKGKQSQISTDFVEILEQPLNGESQFTRGACYLTYFGLPEPAGTSGFSWTFFGVTAMAICIGIAIFKIKSR